jgi:hypothetical protein
MRKMKIGIHFIEIENIGCGAESRERREQRAWSKEHGAKSGEGRIQKQN